MKIIALDLDGVLSLQKSGWKSFDPECLVALRHILEQVPDCKMVLSSCWRKGFINWDKTVQPSGLIDANQALEVIRKKFIKGGWTQELADRLIDRTPVLRGDPSRGQEISEWIKRHPGVSHICVIDDDSDIEPFHSVHVQTRDEFGGLSMADAEKAIKFLTLPTE